MAMTVPTDLAQERNLSKPIPTKIAGMVKASMSHIQPRIMYPTIDAGGGNNARKSIAASPPKLPPKMYKSPSVLTCDSTYQCTSTS